MQFAGYTELRDIFTEQYWVDVYNWDGLVHPAVHILYLVTNTQKYSKTQIQSSQFCERTDVIWWS